MIGSRPTTRLVSYNVHRCIGAGGESSVERVADVLRELRPDVVGLQEVLSSEQVPRPGQLERLADAVGLEPVAGSTLADPDGRYGNGLLLARPPLEVVRHDLSVPGREPRGALEVVISSHAGPVRVVTTHLGLSARERRVQIGRLVEILRARSEPLLGLLGDVNEWRGWLGRSLREVDRLLQPVAVTRTFPSSRPLVSLDRIWVDRRFDVVEAGHHPSPAARVASDHLPVYAEVGAAPEDDDAA